jgi:hypothetical protein
MCHYGLESISNASKEIAKDRGLRSLVSGIKTIILYTEDVVPFKFTILNFSRR